MQNVVLHHRSVVLTEGSVSPDSISIMMQMLMEWSTVTSLLARRHRHFSVWTERAYKAKQEHGNVILVSG